MPTSLIVVDDFLEHATGLREAGLRLTYPDQERASATIWETADSCT